MARVRIQPFFLARDEHSLFCLLFTPPQGVPQIGAIVHVPAFAEEMNKSRRAANLAARAMAERGWHVLIFDLHGTGDSSGDFGDASWSGWALDLRAAIAWLRGRTGSEPVLWGLRTGCLLINEVLESVVPSKLIFWQPTLSGEAALTQFLRLRSVGNLGSRADRQKESTKTLFECLQGGSALEVAGYLLAPMLAMPLKKMRLGGASYAGRRVTWLEVSASDPPQCSPASSALIGELRSTGASVVAVAVAGVSFWTTQEIDEAALLVSATVKHALSEI